MMTRITGRYECEHLAKQSADQPFVIGRERVPRALVQVMACLTYWDARPAGGGADVGDCGVRGVLPEVVGLPPGDLILWVWRGPAMDAGCGQDCVLELGVLPSAEGDLGQESLA